jgi:hypothetical protein
MVTLMGVFWKYWVFQKVLSVTSYQNGDKYKLTGISNVRSEVTITKDHFTTFASEMTLMYEIPWPPLYNMNDTYSSLMYSDSIIIITLNKMNSRCFGIPNGRS